MAFRGIVSDFMKSAEMDSLQNLAATKVVISVCELEDVQNEIRLFSINNLSSSISGFSFGQWRVMQHGINSGSFSVSGFTFGQWRKLCSTVRNKLEQFGLTAITISIALEKLWPVSFEIAKWILYHRKHIEIESSPNFSWTPRASIDYEKTAKLLIENEVVSINKRFKLACFYCLEGKVRSLWELMSLRERRCFFNRGNLKKANRYLFVSANFNEANLHPFVVYWTYYIQEVPLDCWNEKKAFNPTELFKFAVAHGYLNATKFFHGKLLQRTRNMMVDNCFDKNLRNLYQPEFIMREHLAVAYFLINKRRPGYSIEYSPNIRLVFLYFLEWPLQRFFMPLVNKTRIPCVLTFGFLLEGIFEKIILDFKDYDYKTVFMEFWLQSTEVQKRHVNRDSEIGCSIILKFVKKYFGFVFDKGSCNLRVKFRAVVLQKELSENITEFGKEDVEFLRFLVQERVCTRSSVHSSSKSVFSKFQNRDRSDPLYLSTHNVPMEELHYLMDRILRLVQLPASQ